VLRSLTGKDHLRNLQFTVWALRSLLLLCKRTLGDLACFRICS
jgi:hypothetical protein